VLGDRNFLGSRDGKMMTKYLYEIAIALAAASSLFLLMMIGAVGVIGAEGDPFDRVYFGVVGLGVLGALVARFRASGMAYAMFAMALAQAIVIVVALAIGKQDSPVTSVGEIVGLNAFFVVMFSVCGMLFRRAAERVAAAAA
jgi:uncharacterized membrane protein